MGVRILSTVHGYHDNEKTCISGKDTQDFDDLCRITRDLRE